MGRMDRDGAINATGDELDVMFARLEELLAARDRVEIYGRTCCLRPYACRGCPRRSSGL